MSYKNSIFINCPFDETFAPLLEAMLFCVVRAGLSPRLASERLEGGQNRLDKILDLIGDCRFSIHDLSISRSTEVGETFRMNMPFELGLDLGRRRAPDIRTNDKRFLIFEGEPYSLKRSLSDYSGMDPVAHKGDYQQVIKHLREFLTVEAGVAALPGATHLSNEYAIFLGWMTELKMHEGHTAKEAQELPTQERLDAMVKWNNLGRPKEFESEDD